MYTGLLHSHKLFVLLFLLHYVAKLVLLLLNRNEQLAKYSKITKVPEMILSFGFLATGIGMLVSGAALSTLLTVKIICVLASIPLAIIGFKKGNKILAFVAVFLIVMSYGLAEMNKKAKTGAKVDTSAIEDPIIAGKLIYANKCAQCHGQIGNGGVSGAKDLSLTKLTDDEKKLLIRSGKNAMPGFKEDVLTDADLNAVVQYVATLKQ